MNDPFASMIEQGDTTDRQWIRRVMGVSAALVALWDQRDGFLADILANPEDDGVRLIYADWLEDQGDPAQAESIRAQVALARG